MSSSERLRRDLARSKDFRAAFVKSHTKRLLPMQIRELMEQRGYTQTQVADLSSVSQGTISRAIDPEYGNLTVNTCVSIAEGFDVAFIGAFIPYSRFLEWLDEEGEFVDIPAFTEEFDEHGEPQKAAAAARADLGEKLLHFIQKVNDAPPVVPRKDGQLAFVFPNPQAKVIEMFQPPQPRKDVSSPWQDAAREVGETVNG
jgi:transcriptional regulator with XRE-family HTH domain